MGPKCAKTVLRFLKEVIISFSLKTNLELKIMLSMFGRKPLICQNSVSQVIDQKTPVNQIAGFCKV